MLRNIFLACSVCFGDPASLMSKGAVAGALFLMGLVAVVLFGIAWTAFSWAKRAKALENH